MNSFSGIQNLIALLFIFITYPAISIGDTDTESNTNPCVEASESQAQLRPDSNCTDVPTVENPRIVVPENLREMPVVNVVTSDESTTQASKPHEHQDQVAKAEQEQKQFSETMDLDGESLIDQPVLEKTNWLMDISRRPLTYIQNHVPFLTKRNIVFFGRIEFDGALYSSGVLEDDSGFNIRRFRVGLAGHIKRWPGWNYKVELDLTDGENSLSDAYISRHSMKWGTFRFGNQKVAQTLSGQTSSLSISFMERPLPIDAFTLKRRIGFGWDLHRKTVGVNVTIFGQDPNDDIGSHGWAARSYFNPTRSLEHVIHIGASYMQLASDNEARFSARPESNVTDLRLADTGVWPDTATGTALGLELVGAKGPVMFRSEFYQARWTRADSDDPLFKGWYGEASWFLTGEKAHYREGKFIRPNIKSTKGAWELAVRFSSIDLNDLDVEGGTEQNLSFGVNWYSKVHWRFMANIIKVWSDGPYGEENPWIGQVRAQYFF